MGISAKTDLQLYALPAAIEPNEPTGNLLTEKKLLHCDVIFGSPRSDCSGAGICKIVDINSGQRVQLKRNCRLAPALLTASADGKKLTMTFLREFMCVHLLRHHFRTGVLDVQDACPIPDRVVNLLCLTGFAVLPGQYVIEEGLRGFQIYFYL